VIFYFCNFGLIQIAVLIVCKMQVFDSQNVVWENISADAI